MIPLDPNYSSFSGNNDFPNYAHLLVHSCILANSFKKLHENWMIQKLATHT